jgi:predicted dehydrogenase
MAEPLKPSYRVLVLSVVKHAYLPNALAAHPRFELVAVADDAERPDWTHERNERYANQHGIPYHRDPDHALKHLGCEVAVISSEAERHCGLAMRAVESGLHIIVDKPLSPDVSECEILSAKVQERGLRSMVWNRNALPAILEARSLMARGCVGDLLAIHCDFYFSKDAGPPKTSEKPQDPPIHWLQRQIDAHADGSDGGVGVKPLGELQIEGIYPLAYIQALACSSVQRVFACTATHFHQANVDHQVDDLASLSFELANGVMGSLAIGRIGAASHPDIGEIKLHLIATHGSLVISEARPEVAIYYKDQPSAEFKHLRVANENDFLLVDGFAEALDNQREVMFNVPSACEVAKTVRAAQQSAATGHEIRIQ